MKTHLLAVFLFGLVCSQSLDKDHRIDCEPDNHKDGTTCTNRGCIEEPDFSGEPGVPYCYFPPNTGYLAPNLNSPDDKQVHLQKDPNSVKNPFQDDFNDLDFIWNELGSAVHLKITPTNQIRYRPPVPLNDSIPITSTEKLRVKSTNDPIFSFSVIRDSTGTKIWDTSIGGLLFADQYIQIATLLPTDKIYGFGENIHQTLKHQFDGYYSYAMFARDELPDSFTPHNGRNLYGVQNFYIGVENDGKAHGVFFFNSNAQEVTTASAPSLVYRTIGGFLEFFFFPGPTPEDVVRQYIQLVGKPFLPPYWALGFQLCRYGYKGTTEIRDTVKRMRDAQIPQDVQYSDIDYMDAYKDFSYDPTNFGDFPQLADELHNNYSMHLILIFDPAIEADYEVIQRGLAQDARFVEWPSFDLIPQGLENQFPLLNGTKIMLGKVWPSRASAFPDFLDPQGKTQQWWSDEFTRFRQKVPFDGAWIDMNEPSNFDATDILPSNPNATTLVCPTTGGISKWDNPPYATKAAYDYGSGSYLFSKTICMVGTTARNTSLVYNTKSLYGWSESVATLPAIRAATGKRGVVISRSTFASSGRYAGHWLGDNTARWEDLRTSVIGVQEFNMFGIPYVGSDICGFRDATNEELCLRWQQMGAFHSFSRNHNDKGNPSQDPAQWPTVAAAAKKANEFRYRHLPYLYSLHYDASLYGGTVVRPLFFEFPEDPAVHSVNYQFLWGSGMMIVPVVTQGDTSVNAYLPSKSRWYSMYDGYYGVLQTGTNNTYAAPWNFLIPVFIRGGYILPRQASALTTVLSRKNRFELIVALDAANMASGELYWDDGDSIPPDDLNAHNFCHFAFNFKADNDSGATLTIQKTRDCTGITFPYLENIEVFGYPYYPDLASTTVNGNQATLNSYDYSPFTNIVNITGSGLIDYNTGSSWVLKWPNQQ